MRHFFSRLGHFLINGGRRHRVLASVVVTTFCSACVVGDFQGDGRLVDRARSPKKDRYVLDLGPVDLSRTGKYTYTMNNLPDTYFVAGLKIIEVEPDRGGSRPPHLGRLRLLLETSNHDVVISEDSALDSWTCPLCWGVWSRFSIEKGNSIGFQTRTAQRVPFSTMSEQTRVGVPFFSRDEESHITLSLRFWKPRLNHDPLTCS